MAVFWQQAALACDRAHHLQTKHPRRTRLDEPCSHRLKRPNWHSAAKARKNKLRDALSWSDALKPLLECPWVPKGQREGFLEGQWATMDPSPTAEACLQTIHLLASQLTAYSSATAGTEGGGAGVLVTCGDQADSTIIHRSPLRRAAFASSFAEEVAAMQLALKWTTSRPLPPTLKGCCHLQGPPLGRPLALKPQQYQQQQQQQFRILLFTNMGHFACCRKSCHNL